MKYVPHSVSRVAGRTLLKAKAKSPTILVVSGVIGLGATAVMAARATRRIDPVVEAHQKTRWDIKESHLPKRAENKALLDLYTHTGWELGKIYGPTIFVGATSALSVLGGHRILVGRHVASMAAYSGLFNEFTAYRGRVAETFGEDKELALFNGGKLKYVEDPDHKGEYKLEAEYPDEKAAETYLKPWFDERNTNWINDPESNWLFLKGVQSHCNNVLNIRGHLFLNEVMDWLRLPRHPEGQVAGWFRDDDIGDGFVDFGLNSPDPDTTAFRNFKRGDVRLNFNIDGNIYEKI